MEETKSKRPLVCLVLGMAGSGKSALVSRLSLDFEEDGIPGYLLNLDPAVAKLGYEPHVDIRDTVDYKQVRKTYQLGPNGGILTSLNLFATKFDQVLNLCEKRAESVEYIVVDTPGQIEVFTWSASGMIITDAFASSFPTAVIYVVDTPRMLSPTTFIANMTYACSILYKTRLPFLLVFNKTDIADAGFAKEWMTDLQALEDALEQEKNYMATLSRSLGLVLEEFYSSIRCVGLSAMTGDGMDEFFEKLAECEKEYEEQYLPLVENVIAERQSKDKNTKSREKASHVNLLAESMREEFQDDEEYEAEKKSYEEFLANRMAKNLSM